MRRLLPLFCLILLVLMTMAATTDSGMRFTNLGHRLMCTCGCGQVLMECNHVGCQSSDKMRAELRAAMDRGEDDEQILNGFVAKYGPVVLSAPTKTGFNRVAWITPYLALVLGLAATVAVVRLWKSRPLAAHAGQAPPVAPEVLDAYRRRVHEDTEI